MKHTYNHKKAFTMIELVFVIVILGIVASIGADIIARIYESYILQRAQHRSSVKTELSASIIANRLRYAVPGTIFRIKNDGSYESVDSPLSDPSGNSYIGLQWVGSDGDSFESLKDDADATGRRPGWSGFCDLDNSSKTSLNSPASNFAVADTIMKNLSKDAAGTAQSNLGKSAVFFPNDTQEHNVSAGTATANGTTVLTLDDNGPVTFKEQYKLAWSSYALVVEGGNLNLYYNFEPTPQTSYDGKQKQLLMKNVSTFKFKSAGQTMRFKICKEEKISSTFTITSCKEKAVF
jgi:prepilin-type N-terminal cleavage/methylation domain-containing protein